MNSIVNGVAKTKGSSVGILIVGKIPM
jgi:hypothetical protein